MNGANEIYIWDSSLQYNGRSVRVICEKRCNELRVYQYIQNNTTVALYKFSQKAVEE